MTGDPKLFQILGRLEAKSDAIINALEDHTDRMNRIDEDIEDVRRAVFKELRAQEKRVVLLEKKQYGLLAIASVLGSIITITGSILLRKLF